ncbi:LysM peptidoglycan-binding domain-containing protein [Azohydromonas caseinilytica]|uniref:LysM peptidoglycan-binding domain-containing protein n=1 Tax=Azohydromonas caseinilytica TaxID=2728836 RepID=A0A848F1L6_9BURK|nr:LysM domain-containing protein [Azohydromonas caseinilytica]NML13967.1 LysM peptidoglycan-binding domain-containing protein [Azohydromonas caseinilytica]
MALSKKWLDTVERGIEDVRWDGYDKAIQTEIAAYNARLSRTPGYQQVEWPIFKAMLWTESGGPDNPSWNARVMQIGNPGDPAYDVLRQGQEGSALVMPEDLKILLRASANIDKPEVNLRAGIAYLFTRMALYRMESVTAPGAALQTYKVQLGDSFSSIAKKLQTTVALLEKLNAVKPQALKPGMELKYQKASMQQVISGWRPFRSAMIADRYNGGGDPDYATKLDHVRLNLFPKLKRS